MNFKQVKLAQIYDTLRISRFLKQSKERKIVTEQTTMWLYPVATKSNYLTECVMDLDKNNLVKFGYGV